MSNETEPEEGLEKALRVVQKSATTVVASADNDSFTPDDYGRVLIERERMDALREALAPIEMKDIQWTKQLSQMPATHRQLCLLALTAKDMLKADGQKLKSYGKHYKVPATKINMIAEIIYSLEWRAKAENSLNPIELRTCT